jgi:hypothetical protein
MGQICERALSKRFAHRDLLLHRFSVESMAMVGCVFVGKALVRAPKPRRFVAPCEESAGCVHGEGCHCAGVAVCCSCCAPPGWGAAPLEGCLASNVPRFMSQLLGFVLHGNGKCLLKEKPVSNYR